MNTQIDIPALLREAEDLYRAVGKLNLYVHYRTDNFNITRASKELENINNIIRDIEKIINWVNL